MNKQDRNDNRKKYPVPCIEFESEEHAKGTIGCYKVKLLKEIKVED